MSYTRLARPASMLLAVAAAAALTTGGIALAQGAHHHANHGRHHHARTSTAGTGCPASPLEPALAGKSHAAAPPGIAEGEARAEKEALAGKRAPAETEKKEAPVEQEGAAEKAARAEKERLAAGPTPCPGYRYVR